MDLLSREKFPCHFVITLYFIERTVQNKQYLLFLKENFLSLHFRLLFEIEKSQKCLQTKAEKLDSCVIVCVCFFLNFFSSDFLFIFIFPHKMIHTSIKRFDREWLQTKHQTRFSNCFLRISFKYRLIWWIWDRNKVITLTKW